MTTRTTTAGTECPAARPSPTRSSISRTRVPVRTRTAPKRFCSTGAANTEKTATATPQPKNTPPIPYASMPRMKGVKARTVKKP